MHQKWREFLRVAPCLLAMIVDYTGYGLVYPLVTAMFTQEGGAIFPHLNSTHLKDFYLGLSYLLYPLGMFFGASFLGDLSDLWGRKKVILLSVGGIFIGFLLMSLGISIREVYVFLLGRLISGLMAGSLPLAQAAVADISTPDTKPWNMNLVTITNTVGLVFGPIVAGIFSERWFLKDVGFSLPFLFAAFMAIIAFFWIYFGFKETYNPIKGKKVEWIQPARIFVEAFLNQKVRILAFVLLLFQTAVALYFQMLGIYFSDTFHYSSSEIGFFYAYLGACFAISSLFIYPILIKHFKIETLCIVGLFLLAAFEIIVSFLTVAIWIWIVVFLMAICNIFAWSTLLTIFSNAVDKTKQGWVMGIFAAMVAVGFIIAGFSSNILPWVTSNHLVLIGGVAAFLSALLMLSYQRKHGRKGG